MTPADPETRIHAARVLLDGHRYFTLSTADAAGRPWVSPVWLAHRDHTHFVWASKPEARHSRNLRVRPEAAFVVYDTTAAPDDARAVYVEVLAHEAAPAEMTRALAIYNERQVTAGQPEWTPDRLTGEARHRLYVARATAWWLLGDRDDRLALDLRRASTPPGS